MTRSLARRPAGLLLMLLAGCSSQPAAEVLHPVAGEVRLGQAAARGGSVTFVPEGTPRPQQPAAVIGPEGRYELLYKGKPGAPAGKYKVVVRVSETAAADPKSPRPPAVRVLSDAKYADPAKTPLMVEVGPSPAAGAYDLAVSK